MKVVELARSRRGSHLSPLKLKVVQYLEEHEDEVFPNYDRDLARSLGVKVSALNWTLWWLHRNGLIDREEADGKLYFGSRRAVGELRHRLGLTKQDPFQRARANAERIRARTGNVSVLELLDAVRGPWD
jgi:DNA-binding IclR family transcriptional regulator